METELQVGQPLRCADAKSAACQPVRSIDAFCTFALFGLFARCLHGGFQRLCVAHRSTACWRSSWRSCTTSRSKSSAHSGLPLGLPPGHCASASIPRGAARLRFATASLGKCAQPSACGWASLAAQRGGAARCRTLNQRVQRLRMEGAQAQPEAEELAEIKADSTSLLQKIHVRPSRPAPPTRPLKTTRTCMHSGAARASRTRSRT